MYLKRECYLKENAINRNRRLLESRKKPKKLKAFQNIVVIFKINSSNFRFFVLYLGLLGFVVIAYQFCILL